MTDTTIPQCVITGCEREPSWDSEPPSPGYFSTCDRCSSAYVSSVTLHAHRHRYTALQCAANGFDPNHTWLTTTTLVPEVENDEIIRYVCREPLPGGDPCPYSITAEALDIHMKWRHAEHMLCDLIIRSNGCKPPEDATHLIWQAYNEARAARALAFPVDVPN
jgi:hypothetical protein